MSEQSINPNFPEHYDCRCQLPKATITGVQIQIGGEWVDLSSSSRVVGGVLVTDALHNPLLDDLRAIVEADDAKASNGSV
jgi:hypothetical protein